MAKNHIEEMLHMIQSKEDPSEVDLKMAAMLTEKMERLGPNPSEEETGAAVRECLAEMLRSAMSSSGDEEETSVTLSDDDKEYMENATAAVREVLEGEGLHFGERSIRPDVTVFELGLGLLHCHLNMRVIVEAQPRVCRLDAVMPITADEKYAYLLCQAMAKENYPRRYGALQYDERDGEVLYRYSYPIGHGVHKDEFKDIFLAVAHSADASYDVVKKHCVGNYKRREVNAILEKLNDLVDELTDDE